MYKTINQLNIYMYSQQMTTTDLPDLGQAQTECVGVKYVASNPFPHPGQVLWEYTKKKNNFKNTLKECNSSNWWQLLYNTINKNTKLRTFSVKTLLTESEKTTTFCKAKYIYRYRQIDHRTVNVHMCITIIAVLSWHKLMMFLGICLYWTCLESPLRFTISICVLLLC